MLLVYLLILTSSQVILAKVEHSTRLDQDDQKCSCSLISLNRNTQQPNELLDLTHEIVLANPMKTISDLSRCELDCRLEFVRYLNYPELVASEDNTVRFEISQSAQGSSKICALLDRTEAAPGIEVLIQIEKLNSDLFRKYISLGRLCCQRLGFFCLDRRFIYVKLFNKTHSKKVMYMRN